MTNSSLTRIATLLLAVLTLAPALHARVLREELRDGPFSVEGLEQLDVGLPRVEEGDPHLLGRDDLLADEPQAEDVAVERQLLGQARHRDPHVIEASERTRTLLAVTQSQSTLVGNRNGHVAQFSQRP